MSENSSQVVKNVVEGMATGSINPNDVARAIQENVVPIDWAKTYEVLGMSAEYAKFAGSDPLVSAIKLGCWTGPVVKGVTFKVILPVFQSYRIRVQAFADDLDMAITENDREANQASYVVFFAGSENGDKVTEGLSASALSRREVKGITSIECSLLILGHLVTTGKLLNQRSAVLCIGSRTKRFHNVPIVSVVVGSGFSEIHFGYYEVTETSECDSHRTRIVIP